MQKSVILFIVPIKKLPVDVKTPSGYMLAIFNEIVTDTIAMFTYIPLISFMFGSCWVLITFVEDITKDIAAIDADIEAKDLIEFKKKLCKIIKFHSVLKGWWSQNDSTIVTINIHINFLVLG